MKDRQFSVKERKLVVDWIWQSALFLFCMAAFLTLFSGDWRWRWGWLLMISMTLFTAAQPLLLITLNPGLMLERARGFRTGGVKKWDRWISEIAILLWFVSWLMAALDHRFGWSPEEMPVVHWSSWLGLIIGFALFLWAMLSNPFFSEGVRIQADRGHSVCIGGPYRWVRHPGYLGDILASLASPLLLGSLWAFIPSVLSAMAFIIRTHWEDEMLQAELDGYRHYTKRVRFRLFPGVW